MTVNPLQAGNMSPPVPVAFVVATTSGVSLDVTHTVHIPRTMSDDGGEDIPAELSRPIAIRGTTG